MEEAAVGRGEVFLVFEEPFPLGGAVFLADPEFDEFVFIDAVEDALDGLFGQGGSDAAALTEVAGDAAAAKLLAGEAVGGEVFGEAAVVQVGGIFEAADDFVHVTGFGGAAAELFAEFAA